MHFNPLHCSLTAHIFTSTQPVGSTIDRIASSVRSVGIPADFLYQDIQIQPPGAVCVMSVGKIVAALVDSLLSNGSNRLPHFLPPVCDQQTNHLLIVLRRRNKSDAGFRHNIQFLPDGFSGMPVGLMGRLSLILDFQ